MWLFTGSCGCVAELKLKLDHALTQFVIKHTDSSQRRAKNQYLLGNFAPVKDAIHVQDLAIEGTMPQCLEGVFVRYAVMAVAHLTALACSLLTAQELWLRFCCLCPG